jgi:hypothetical protein
MGGISKIIKKASMKINSIFTTKTLAKKFGITEQTLLSWRSQGMPIIKIGKIILISEDSFLKWLKSREKAQDAF